MTELLWLFAGLICGAGVVFLWTKARMSSLQTLLQVREEEMEKRRIEMEESVERQSQDFKEREERMENHLAALQERCEALNRENKGLPTSRRWKKNWCWCANRWCARVKSATAVSRNN